MSEPSQRMFEVDDAIVLLLGAPSKVRTLTGRLEGATRLEKLLFLLERETEVGKLLTERLDFKAHNFGPFSAKSYQAIDTLAAAGLIRDSARQSDTTDDSWEVKSVIGNEEVDEYATRNFELTPLGQQYYNSLISELPKSVESTVASFKARFGPLPLRQLVRYVYQSYPQYTDKSLIKAQVLDG